MVARGDSSSDDCDGFGYHFVEDGQPQTGLARDQVTVTPGERRGEVGPWFTVSLDCTEVNR